MKKLLLLSFFMVLGTVVAIAQRTLSGNVSDERGEPLIGANVVVKGTTTGTITDIDGNYRLTAPANAEVLIVSYTGFSTQEVTLGASNVVNVVLSEGVVLEGAVVTAFGIKREEKALAYSVQEVDGTALTKVGQTNVTNALQGKIAGVQVNQSSGMPGASSFITVRGANSFNLTNEPLYVIDGMPIASTANESFSGEVSGTDYSSRSLDINMEDIESISVLKGPSAAALYGMRASNGVVLITTKKGNRELGKPRVTLSQTYTMDQVSRIPDLQSTYAQGAGGNLILNNSNSWGPRIADLDIYQDITGTFTDGFVYDNVTPFFQNGHTSMTNVAVDGSIAGRGAYAFSTGYTDQSGIIPTTGMDKWNFRLSADYDLSDKWTTGANANFIRTNIDKLAGGSNLSNPLFTLYWAPRSFDLWGTPMNASDNEYAQINYRAGMDNPRWSLRNNSFNENITRTIGNAYVQYKPIPELTIRYTAGIDNFTEVNKEIYSLGSGFTGGRATILPRSTIVDPTALPSGGQITDYTRNYSQLNSNFNIMWNKKLSDLITVDAILGNEYIDINSTSLQVVGAGIQIGGFDNMNNTSSQVTTQLDSRQRQIGNYLNANVGIGDFLYVNAGVRADRVSNMPNGNRDFVYPNVGASFVFSEFLPTGSLINFGKVRASFAEVGQAGPLFVSATPFVSSTPGTGFTNDGIQFPFNGLAGFNQSTILRSNELRPQNTRSLEFGIQMSMLNNRLGIDVTYFNDNTTDQIFAVPIAASTGYLSEIRNAGEMQGSGWEVTLSYSPIVTTEFRWDMMVNFTRIRTEVISLADGVENIFLGGFVTPNVRAQAGSLYPVIFGSKYLRDDAGNIVYDSRQFIGNNVNPAFGMPMRDPVNAPLANVNPEFELGFINNFSYKGFTLTAQIDWRHGGYAWAGNTRLQKLYGMDAVTEDRDTPWVGDGVKGYLDSDGQLIVEGENDIAILRNQAYWSVYMDAIEESNIYETSFVRLREVNLSYDLPRAFLENIGIQRASVFVMGRNLWLSTKYPNFDPETSVGGASNFQGLEYVNLPQMKSFGAGLRVTF